MIETPSGTPFLAPAGWTVHRLTEATVLRAPDGHAQIAVADTRDVEPDTAAAIIWERLRPGRAPRAPESVARPSQFGWDEVRALRYEGPGDAALLTAARAMRRGDQWTLLLLDIPDSVMAIREPQVTRVISSIRAPGFAPMTLVGKQAHELDAARLRLLVDFLDTARRQLDIPGLALGVVQGGEVKYAGGLGVREHGKSDPVTADTLFLSASITKPLTSLLLARLVDRGKLSWDSPAADVLPQFRVGDEVRSREILVRHLLCSCTGIPARDMEWIFAGETMKARDVLNVIASTSPTAGIGELYQYSNLLAAAGGILAGHVAYPRLPLDAGYDRAMQRLVFDPLNMKRTTFDFARAQRGNHARPHGATLDGRIQTIPMHFNQAADAMRADGGAWSSVNDLSRYLQMELAGGLLPNGRRFIGRDALLERQRPQVARGGLDQWYGMGLKTDRQRGILQVRHGGNMAGFQGELFWLPEFDTGFVLLMNSDLGSHVRSPFVDRFVEVLFDTDLGATGSLAAVPDLIRRDRDETREGLDVPPPDTAARLLAAGYVNGQLGRIDVRRKGDAIWLDFGGWDSEVGARAVGDDRYILETVSPGVQGYRFTLSARSGVSELVLDDAPRTYTFVELPGKRPASASGDQ
jgi:CubicO group peptidase (beta-lactamase class C family)